MYDYIIIDTPPLMWVTDALLLMKHVDTAIYVIRQDVTNKRIFEAVIKDLEERKYNISLIVNGINYQGVYGYRYSYGYGGYGKYGRYGKYGKYGAYSSQNGKRSKAGTDHE